MGRLQFSLRQLLIAVILVAAVLLLVRFAIQSHGAAVALLVVAIAATVLLLANVAVFAMLRGIGLIFGMEPVDGSKPSVVTVAPSEAGGLGTDPNEPRSNSLNVGHD
jgi:hypothetical protein